MIRGFVEESIRWASPPVQQFTRYTAQDYEFHGETIKKGDIVYLSFLAANFDDDVFDQPDIFISYT